MQVISLSRLSVLPALAAFLSVACTVLPQSTQPPAAVVIRAESLLADVRELSSDAYAGRLPGTAGEEKTVDYLVTQYKAMGLAPGNPDGSYVQKVPLVGITGEPSLALRAGGKTLALRRGEDYVVTTARFERQVDIADSPLVFVGYGVQAAEYGWDDYKGLDVRGKTLVMLINDPAVPSADDPTRLDAALFRGKAMTYYGRWTYKYDIGSKLGAAGVIIVHEDGPAGYPWAVVKNSWTGEQFELAAENGNRDRVPVQGWITQDVARDLFAAAGQDFDQLKKTATRSDFQPVALNATASATIRNTLREVQSHNVVARLPGSDPARAAQTIIYSAHWDHLGTHRDGAAGEDSIFNGALDNASGIAGVLAIARAYSALPTAPARSLLFMHVTAEEQGLLGARHYASQPLYPLAQTVAMINLDGLNPWGPTQDMQVIGMGQNTLEDTLADVLAASGRVTVPDQEPGKGFYFRSDQFEFAKRGVPALYADGGSDVIGKPGYGMRKRAEYTANDYHKPSDEVKDDWDLSGAAQDMQALFEVGRRVADDDSSIPQWKDGSEFKALRTSP